ncbi:hypothetical protein B0H14DRAFT_3631852 [Mycena olivaceomarginata]|nr:hypothetical protein B0H14DRAFT_3631852 [Mycena olivaceomarginata]
MVQVTSTPPRRQRMNGGKCGKTREARVELEIPAECNILERFVLRQCGAVSACETVMRGPNFGQNERAERIHGMEDPGTRLRILKMWTGRKGDRIPRGKARLGRDTSAAESKKADVTSCHNEIVMDDKSVFLPGGRDGAKERGVGGEGGAVLLGAWMESGALGQRPTADSDGLCSGWAAGKPKSGGRSRSASSTKRGRGRSRIRKGHPRDET